ncbi:MAG: DUF983 domain-containing protein [Gemmatimonadota bacterium]|nr:DUF983 domain-containing protein [Gemmatimonadota bacterium]
MQRWGRQGEASGPALSFPQVTARALTLLCPRCGGWGIFRSWFRLKPECPTCGLALERGESEDHWFGAVAVNLVATELLGVGAILVWIVAAWPDVPWTAVQYAGPLIMIALPVLFYPFSRALWLAWDLYFRPAAPGDRKGLPAP